MKAEYHLVDKRVVANLVIFNHMKISDAIDIWFRSKTRALIYTENLIALTPTGAYYEFLLEYTNSEQWMTHKALYAGDTVKLPSQNRNISKGEQNEQGTN